MAPCDKTVSFQLPAFVDGWWFSSPVHKRMLSVVDSIPTCILIPPVYWMLHSANSTNAKCSVEAIIAVVFVFSLYAVHVKFIS